MSLRLVKMSCTKDFGQYNHKKIIFIVINLFLVRFAFLHDKKVNFKKSELYDLTISCQYYWAKKIFSMVKKTGWYEYNSRLEVHC